MAFKQPPAARLAIIPGRQSVYRASSLLLACAAIGLLSMGKSGNPTVSKLRTSILDVVTPVISVVSSPIEAMHSVGDWFSDMAHLRSENIALKNQNLQLLKWQTTAKEMAAENKALRGMLKVVPAKGATYVTAHIVGDLGGPYANAALIDGGSDNGIKKDFAVINENGLVGRVIDVGQSSARVLLLSDINSRVPVLNERTREKAMLVGDHDGAPVLSYLASGNDMKEGDQLVTSGDGGVFPAGLPVGVIARVGKHAVTVQPFADISRIEFVNVVDSGFKKP